MCKQHSIRNYFRVFPLRNVWHLVLLFLPDGESKEGLDYREIGLILWLLYTVAHGQMRNEKYLRCTSYVVRCMYQYARGTMYFVRGSLYNIRQPQGLGPGLVRHAVCVCSFRLQTLLALTTDNVHRYLRVSPVTGSSRCP